MGCVSDGGDTFPARPSTARYQTSKKCEKKQKTGLTGNKKPRIIFSHKQITTQFENKEVIQMSSDVRTITLAQAQAELVICFKRKRPVFLWGPPGVGKSEMAQQIAESGELGKTHLIDIRLALYEPTDIRGIPYRNGGSNMMDWSHPSDLPTQEFAENYDTIILFLDEMNSAAPAVQAAAYQLILNRRIGQYNLPKNVVICAAGNRDSDKGVTYRMPTPLANRFVHLEVRPDFQSWMDWAVTTGNIHPGVVGFLNFSKGDLFNFDPRSSGRSFATPRSWTYVSDFLYSTANTEQLTDLISGCVGEGTAIKFMTHWENSASLPNPADILSGKVTGKDMKKNVSVSAQWALMISLCYELRESSNTLGKKNVDQWHEQVDRFFEFIMDQFNVEMAVMATRLAVKTYQLKFVPSKLKSYKEFYKRYAKFIEKAMS